MSALRFMIALTLACLVAAAPFNEVVEVAPAADDVGYRLTQDIMPERYTISLRPYLLETDAANKRFKFDGEVTITVIPKVNTNKLEMHSKNLAYSVSSYWPENNPGNPVELRNPVTNPTTDKITWNLETTLTANTRYVLKFVYEGLMEDDMHGFYRSSYQDAQNNTKWLGSTQFQTNHARRAFPSFDEPIFKAQYTVSLTRHKSMKSYSNTRIISTIRHATDNNYYTDNYETTPKMSTYLLAFIVSEFNERFDGDFGVIARPENYHQTEYSHQVGKDLLKWFDEYLNLPYYSMGNDKMHMAAIPDFSAGAMENWGLLTYRERALLFEEGSTTLSAKQYIAAVVAHEQAHMWFGDLVTCDWWSYTWLNEGFARYFQYFGTGQVAKEYHMESQFTVDQIQSVMNMDSTNATNPMSDEETYSPADLSRMFNSISYNKGATIIRMISHIMGETNFRDSLGAYLQEHKYKNTVPQNLLTAWLAKWPADSKGHAENIFKSFTQQVGYPVININVKGGTNSFEVSQKRFLLKLESDGSDANLVYTVPITYTTSDQPDFANTSPKIYLEANTNTITHSVGKNFSWVIANIQQTGYYRVNYDEHTWHQIHHALMASDWSNIHDFNRAQIVDDLLNLARADHVSYTLAFDVLHYLSTETSYMPWTAAFNGFSYLAIRMGVDTANFGKYILQQTEKAYQMLGFVEREVDNALDIYNRAKVLAWACKYGNSECISRSKAYFYNMMRSPVPVNIRSAVYCTAMREGNDHDFDTLFNKYKTETVATEQTLILNSLGCVKQQALIEKYFNIIVSDDVRRQDKSAALTSLYTENNENVSPVFKLVTDNHENLGNSMGGLSAVATVISNIAARFTEESQLNELKAFNTANKAKFGASASTLEKAEVTVAENLHWSSVKLKDVKDNVTRMLKSGSASTSMFTAFTLVLFAAISMIL